MSKIKCFNRGEYGHFACDCPKACNNANVARESEQKDKLESMQDLDSTSVSEECAMVCMELQYEDASEDQVVYGDQGISAEEYEKATYSDLTKTQSEEEDEVKYTVAQQANNSVILERKRRRFNENSPDKKSDDDNQSDTPISKKSTVNSINKSTLVAQGPAEHMKSSSKGASEKRRLTQYVTNTVLDDNYKGTTEQFVLLFNEQFRQVEEISEESEHFPPQIKLQLLQNAVRPINDLRIVETLDEFQSITTGYGRSSTLKYQTYYDLLINACIRYDRTKKPNIAKRGHIYQTNFSQSNDNFIDNIPSETPIGDPYMGIDTPSDELYNINTNQSGPLMSARHKLKPRLLRSNPNNKTNTFLNKSSRQKWTGPIYLPGHIYKLLSQEGKDALQKYNVEAIQKYKASRYIYETELMHNVYEHAEDELPPSIDEEEFQECQQFNTDQDLEPPTDDILEFITSQGHSDDQLDQVVQTYQAYQQSQFETETPSRHMNAHITYHVAQAKQAKHGSLVDRGANGGLAGSDVRILSTSCRKCTVTGIDNHEIPGLDLVQCASLVQTNQCMVNLIMNEYAYYGRGHSIHSSHQIEWYTNTVDDESVQVGGQKRIVTIDGYSMPLVCKGGLMYLPLQGIPTDQKVQNYPSVHLTSPHKWDPSVLDYEHPENNGEPDWAIDPNENFQFDPNFDEFGDYINRSLSFLDIIDETPKISPIHNLLVNKQVFQ